MSQWVRMVIEFEDLSDSDYEQITTAITRLGVDIAHEETFEVDDE